MERKKTIEKRILNRKKIIEQRNALGLSQTYMAKKLHMSQASYSRREVGNTRVTEREFKQIMEIFGI